MMIPQLAELQHKARWAKRKAVWGAIAGALMALAFVFFAIAAWIQLTGMFGILYTALGFGAVLFLAGLVARAIANRPPRVVPKSAARQLGEPAAGTPQGMTTASLVNALMLGITLGRALRK